MKAYILAEPGQGVKAWKMVSRPDPRPGAGEVLVGVRAASLNYRDWMIARGLYFGEPKKEVIPLSDGAGEVLGLGDGVRSLQKGDRVAGAFLQKWLAGPMHRGALGSDLGGSVDGMLAEKVVLREEGLVKLPPGLSFEEAATLPCAAVTAWNALMESPAPLKPGSTLLTLGSGGVSIFAFQFAKASGCRVIGTTGTDSKRARLKEMGFDLVLNHKDPEWHEEVRKFTDSEGADQVIEVGGNTLARSLKAVRYGGTVSLVGGLGGWNDPVTLAEIMGSRARLQPIMVGSVAMFEAMNRAIETLAIQPVIDEVYPFDAAKDALAKLETGSHLGKIVIRV